MPESELLGPTSHVYVSQRLRLHYNDWGNAGAPPLILIHGGRDHSRNWDWVAQELREDWHIIAPDLRGHGDSEWSKDGNYTLSAYVYDLAQLIHQLGLGPVNIVAHSLGASIALRYASIYPETVRKLVSIEGTGAWRTANRHPPIDQQLRKWIEDRRAMSGRAPRRYQNIEEAWGRMLEENQYLTPEQARDLTVHAVARNEDGTWSWKFDNYVRSIPPIELPEEQLHYLWSCITCPVLMMWGARSWATHPVEDGTLAHFRDARVVEFADAGHWIHHDQFVRFIAELRAFL